jgi:hypothetical protein
MSTDRISIDTLDLSALDLDDQAVEDLYEGAPASFSDPGPETIPLEQDPMTSRGEVAAAMPDLIDDPDAVILVNVRYPEERLFLMDDDGHRDKVQFMDGLLVTRRETADRVRARAPYVFEEPKQGEWHVFQRTGFRTRNAAAFAAYVEAYYRNL